MEKFKKGDILVGSKNKFHEAYHPIVFIEGSEEEPRAVVLTHKNQYPCNIELLNIYDNTNNPQYFVAHLIAKIADWGPYTKIGQLKKEDLDIIENHIDNSNPILWSQYQQYAKGGCPDHATR